MKMTKDLDQAHDYERIAKAIQFLEQHVAGQPQLSEVARHVHLSPFHLQRIFRRWAGISPKRFLQVLTVDYCKALLDDSRSVLDASLAAGLSGPGRMHDLFVNLEAMTPGEFKSRASGLAIGYGFHETPFGRCILAATERGICALQFIENERDALRDLRERWPNALLRPDEKRTGALARRIFYGAEGGEVKVDVPATNFEAKVWQALLQIPRGAVVSYEDLARFAGCPRASRAVGSAVGRNPVGFLIPCHRVIRKTGVIGDYRWGHARKRAMLAWEAAAPNRL